MLKAPLPFCHCGCGRRVKRRFVWRRGKSLPVRFYDRDCYTRSGQRAANQRNYCERMHYQRRARKFGRFVDRLPQRMTRGDLMAMLSSAVGYFVSLEAEKWKARVKVERSA